MCDLMFQAEDFDRLFTIEEYRVTGLFLIIFNNRVAE